MKYNLLVLLVMCLVGCSPAYNVKELSYLCGHSLSNTEVDDSYFKIIAERCPIKSQILQATKINEDGSFTTSQNIEHEVEYETDKFHSVQWVYVRRYTFSNGEIDILDSFNYK